MNWGLNWPSRSATPSPKSLRIHALSRRARDGHRAARPRRHELEGPARIDDMAAEEDAHAAHLEPPRVGLGRVGGEPRVAPEAGRPARLHLPHHRQPHATVRALDEEAAARRIPAGEGAVARERRAVARVGEHVRDDRADLARARLAQPVLAPRRALERLDLLGERGVLPGERGVRGAKLRDRTLDVEILHRPPLRKRAASRREGDERGGCKARQRTGGAFARDGRGQGGPLRGGVLPEGGFGHGAPSRGEATRPVSTVRLRKSVGTTSRTTCAKDCTRPAARPLRARACPLPRFRRATGTGCEAPTGRRWRCRRPRWPPRRAASRRPRP